VLAQQTGIALANARLHGRERVISRELRAANTALEASVAALERSTVIHDRLTRTALAGEGHDGIAQAVHDLTGLAVAVEDAHGNLRAWAGPDQPEPYPKEPPRVRQALLAQARDQGQPLRSGDRVIALAAAGEGVVEVLALVDPDHTVGPHERVALEHGATVLAIELSRLRSIAEAQLRLGGDLVHHLLAGTNDEDGLISHARVLGYDLLRPHRVVLVDAGAAAPAGEAFLHAVRRAARDAEIGTLVATRRDQVVVLADGDGGWEDFRKAVVRESGGGHCRVGVGGIADRPVDLPRSLHEATLAVRMEDAARGSDHVAVYDELGVYRLLAAVEDTDTIETFVTEWLGSLRAYDERRRSDLVLTLTRYLECGRSLEATANELSIHRSTLKYRLQRIKEISGHDLGDPDIGFTLQLATRAWQTLTAMRGSGD
jgi:sugar diacid utilization regulator